MPGRDSFGAESTFEVAGRPYRIHRLSALAGVAELDRVPYSIKLLLENLLRHEDGFSVQAADIEALARYGTGVGAQSRDRLLAGTDTAPGLHRRAVRRRPRRHARRHRGARRCRRPDQPARTRRPRHRPLGRRRRLRAPRRPGGEHGPRVRAQRRALPLLALGPAGLLEHARRAARHRHLSPVQPRVPEQRRVHRRRRRRLPRHSRRHRLAHPDGERPRRARLGRGRHRGGGCHARPADLDARAACRRPAPHRRAARGHDGHRPRPHGRRAAAPPRRRRQVRRVLRPRRGQRAAREPGDDRQHVAGVRLHRDDLPDRRRDAPLPAAHRSPRGALSASSRPTPRTRASGTNEDAEPYLLRARRARPLDDRAEHRRTLAAPGPRPAAASKAMFAEALARSLPEASTPVEAAAAQLRCAPRRRDRVRPRARPRRHRRHHELHEHLQPAGDDRRRPGRKAAPSSAGSAPSPG